MPMPENIVPPISKREYYAGKAMEALIPIVKGLADNRGIKNYVEKIVAEKSVAFADALLDELEKGK